MIKKYALLIIFLCSTVSFCAEQEYTARQVWGNAFYELFHTYDETGIDDKIKTQAQPRYISEHVGRIEWINARMSPETNKGLIKRVQDAYTTNNSRVINDQNHSIPKTPAEFLHQCDKIWIEDYEKHQGYPIFLTTLTTAFYENAGPEWYFSKYNTKFIWFGMCMLPISIAYGLYRCCATTIDKEVIEDTSADDSDDEEEDTPPLL